jgi:aquaporin Z
MEGAEIALFMISACLFSALFQHPSSPVRQAFPNEFLRRLLTGLAMAATAMAIIYSPLGKRTGAHFNPSVTLTYLRLKKIEFWDAVFYIAAQFAGSIVGVAISAVLLQSAISDRHVNYAVTLPGPTGTLIAFAAEIGISFFLFLTVLFVSNHAKLSRFTPLFVGALVASYITFESPFSGMSMNPARTLGSALLPRLFDGLWIYFVGPVTGMLLAAELFVRIRSLREVHCAKFHHHNFERCIFRCEFGRLLKSSQGFPRN